VAKWFLGKDPDNSPQGGSPSSRDDGDSHVIRRFPVTVRFSQPLMHLFPELSSGR
jgi:hypothetical protein